MRSSSKIVRIFLDYDARLTNSLVSILLRFSSFQSLRVHCKFLEISCDGIVWLTTWIALIWLINSKTLYQMQLNMLIGLVFDIVIIAMLKALLRRRRPIPAKDMLIIGPDKFSFPSGHASRAFLVLSFFTKLYALPLIVRIPIATWAVTIVFSRLILRRHYILDVCVGAIIGICETFLLEKIWISEKFAISIIGYTSEDYLPGGSE